MSYDIFDPYRKKLNESVDSRFNDVPVQETTPRAASTREEMFDKAFESVYGLREDTETGSNLDIDTILRIFGGTAGFKRRVKDVVDNHPRISEDEVAEMLSNEYLDAEDVLSALEYTGVYHSLVESSTSKSLTEDFGNFPDWLKKCLAGTGKNDWRSRDLRKQLTRNGIDLAMATYIPGQLPRNARDPAFKDTTKLAVYRMVDASSTHPVGVTEVVYIPGYLDPDVYPDPNNPWTRYKASTISKKKLLELTTEYGYIDLNDLRNRNDALRQQRASAKRGMITRDRAAGQSPIKGNFKYGTDENGRTDYDNILSYDVEWITKRGYDKSGYRLDPDKYGEMLDAVGLNDYSVRLEMMYNKIEKARQRIIDLMNKYDVRTSTRVKSRRTFSGSIFGDISSIVQTLDNVLRNYCSLERDIQKIITSSKLAEEDKDKQIRWQFSFTGKMLRRDLKELNDSLREAETATIPEE